MVDWLLGDDDIYTLSNLLPKTQYMFRARARNLAGFSDSSNIIFLHTSDVHEVGELLGTNSTTNAATAPWAVIPATHLVALAMSWMSSPSLN